MWGKFEGMQVSGSEGGDAFAQEFQMPIEAERGQVSSMGECMVVLPRGPVL